MGLDMNDFAQFAQKIMSLKSKWFTYNLKSYCLDRVILRIREKTEKMLFLGPAGGGSLNYLVESTDNSMRQFHRMQETRIK